MYRRKGNIRRRETWVTWGGRLEGKKRKKGEEKGKSKRRVQKRS